MEHPGSQKISEEDLEVKDIKILSPKEVNDVKIKNKRKFKRPLTTITSRNLKIWEEVFLNLQKVPTKEWIKDYLECQSFIKEHKSLQRLSETRKIGKQTYWS